MADIHVCDATDMSEGAVKCREWRHKLQKAFLTKSLPDEKVSQEFEVLAAQLLMTGD